MPRFRVIHRQTGETWEVEALNSEVAAEVIGWSEKICRIIRLVDEPIADIIPPKVALQIKPPSQGSSHACPECKVSLLEMEDKGEFWWQCPSCDLLYQEWENRYFHADEI